MELTNEQVLQRAIAAHKEGKLQQAESLYRVILRSQPRHPHANHNLGVVAVSLNKVKAALPLFKIALEVSPELEQFWLSYIGALIKEKQVKIANEVIAQAKKQKVALEKLSVLEAQLTDITLAGKIKITKHEKKLSFSEKHRKLSADKKKRKAREQSIINSGPTQEQSASLIESYQNGQYVEAESLALSITQQFPSHPLGWRVLGAVLGQAGRWEEALSANQKAVQLSPQAADAHNNLGDTLEELGRMEEAIASFRKAIAIKPDFAGAYFNLGNTLKKLGKLEEAESSFRQAIVTQPDDADTLNNLGITLQELGRLEEAEASYRQAIGIKGDFFEAMMNLSTVLNYMDNLDGAVDSLRKILQLDKHNYGLKAGVSLAILKFLENNFSESKNYLLAASKIQQTTSPDFKNERVYQKYLLRLIEWHKDKVSKDANLCIEGIISVIGESHSLASQDLHIQKSNSGYLCKSFLVIGCKQWDLGNAIRNKQKVKFEKVFHSLPESSTVLLAVGEIDCRLDAGILKHRNRFPGKKIEELVATTIGNYLSYIAETNSSCQHDIIIQGVPCPNIEIGDVSEDKICELIELIEMFNLELREKAKEKGFGFLDIHKLTDRGDGFSNGIWNIDEIHLSPAGMQAAWREHYIP